MNKGILITISASFILNGCGGGSSAEEIGTASVVLDTLKNDGLSTTIPSNAPMGTIGVIAFELEAKERNIFVTFNNQTAQEFEQKLISTSDASFYDVVNYNTTDDKSSIQSQLELVKNGMETNTIIPEESITINDLSDNFKNITFTQKTDNVLETAILTFSESNSSASINSILHINLESTKHSINVNMHEKGNYTVHVKGLRIASLSNSIENNTSNGGINRLPTLTKFSASVTNSTVEVSGTVNDEDNDNILVTLYVDNIVYKSLTLVTGTSFKETISGLSMGQHEIKVTTNDGKEDGVTINQSISILQ